MKTYPARLPLTEPATRSLGGGLTDVIAVCRACEWEGGHGGATAAAGIAEARRHAAKTGHRTGVSITRVYEYERT